VVKRQSIAVIDTIAMKRLPLSLVYSGEAAVNPRKRVDLADLNNKANHMDKQFMTYMEPLKFYMHTNKGVGSNGFSALSASFTNRIASHSKIFASNTSSWIHFGKGFRTSMIPSNASVAGMATS
jgi:hypothetical protein